MSKDPSSCPKGVPTCYKAQRPKRRRRSVMTDSRRQLFLMIPVVSDGILKWNHFHRFSNEIIFPSICRASKTEFICDLVTSLMQTAPGLQNGLKVDLVWTSIFTRVPLLVLHTSKTSSMCLLVLSLVPKHNIIIR
jgi:hypothetical protein